MTTTLSPVFESFANLDKSVAAQAKLDRPRLEAAFAAVDDDDLAVAAIDDR